MKTNLLNLKSWTAWRFLKMVLGLFFVGTGIYRMDGILIVGGIYLSAIALFNVGCSGGSCQINP